jgi:hypothetical protein
MATVNAFPITTTPMATVLQSLNFALYKATSTTSLAIEVAEKVFTTQAGKDFAAGDFVIATSDADETNYMFGQISAYSGTSLTVDVQLIGGTGTLADWTIRLSGPAGAFGSLIFVQDSAPSTSEPNESIWVDADSTDLDLYQLLAGVWTDTGTNIKGLQGIQGASFAATSASSQTIGSSGTKTFTTQAGLAYQVGTRARASDAAVPATNWMEGVVSSYSGTTLAFTADKSLGSGTLTDWLINVAGQPGTDGAGVGDMIGADNLAEGAGGVASAATAFANIKQAATDIASGVVELATDAEALTGTDMTRTLTPANLTAAGIKQGYHTVNLLAAGMVRRTTNGAASYASEKATNDVMIAGYEFSASVEQAIQIAYPAPKGMDGASALKCKFYATTATAGTGNVIWGIRGRYVRDDDAIDGAWGTAAETTDAFLADGDQHISSEVTFTPGGTFGAECMLYVEVYRKAADGSDTYTQTMVLQAAMTKIPINAATDV